jgi:hypothetical protein
MTPQYQITSGCTHSHWVMGIQSVWLNTAPRSTRHRIHKDEGWLTLTRPRGGKRPCPGFACSGSYFGGKGVMRGYVRWRWHNVPGRPNFPRPSQMVRSHMGMIFGEVGPVFEWSGKGREAYSRQWAWLRDSEEGLSLVVSGHDAIRWCANASWFKWLEGSAPLFWNWPRKYQTKVRDGPPHYLMGDFGPPFLRAQKRHKDPVKHELMRVKVAKVQRLDYIRTGRVVSGTHFFSVDKGTTDIRMVYNGTSCGLNYILYAPHFSLPTVRETLRAVLPGFFQCDLDVQDQFLNFSCTGTCKSTLGWTSPRYARRHSQTRRGRRPGQDGGRDGRETGWG